VKTLIPSQILSPILNQTRSRIRSLIHSQNLKQILSKSFYK
jgi:hypothetical protein